MQLAYYLVFEADRYAQCTEAALVLQSQGIKYELFQDEDQHQLWVAEHDLAAARIEIASYRQENLNWRPNQKRIKFDYLNSRPGLWAYIFVMLLVAWAAGASVGDYNWFYLGKVDAGLVRAGEWWRTVTALTLHADVAHLSSNLIFGITFGFFAGQYLGWGVAWLAILLAGASGNWLNSYIQSASHTSVGASTAIFGALGLVAAFSWKRKLFPQDRWAYRVGPIVGGIALLAFTGIGGERTDVGAHLTGFFCGVLIGTLFAVKPISALKNSTHQWLAGLTTSTIIALSWWLALS